MVIPRKHSGIYTVESTAPDPHLAGFLEVRLSADGVSIRWLGEAIWQSIEWYEIAVLAGTPGAFRETLEALRVQAFEEGMSDGVKTKPDETAALNYIEELQRFREKGGEFHEPMSPDPNRVG